MTLFSGFERPITHTPNLLGQTASLSSSYYAENCLYNPVGNLIWRQVDGKESYYTYDPLNQLTSEPTHNYVYDSLYNRTEKNENSFNHNSLNELLTQCQHDSNGNLITKESWHYVYDPLNQLVEASNATTKINFLYDPLGRRLSKSVAEPTPLGRRKTSRENYLYDGYHEIGAVASDHTPKNFRVSGANLSNGTPSIICVEVKGKPFAPILDSQGNICRLIDPATKSIASSYVFTAFGETVSATSDDNPWRFASKRLDPELNLIHFGKRYYDPELGRWLSVDPMGFVDSMNLYQYVLNNPFYYTDPDGQFIFAIPLLALSWKVVAVALVTAYVSYELEHQSRHAHSDVARAFNSTIHQMLQGSMGLAFNQALEEKKKEKEKEPPYSGDKLGEDPARRPGEEFEWRGKGEPGSRKGSWFNPETGESLHPDLDHPPPKKPHWDYESADGEKARLNVDGTWEWKL